MFQEEAGMAERTATREDVAATLRRIADRLERDDTAELEGEITLIRTVPPTQESIKRWAAAGHAWPEPAPQKTRFTLHLGNGAFSQQKR
jgi:hypothetical protein